MKTVTRAAAVRAAEAAAALAPAPAPSAAREVPPAAPPPTASQERVFPAVRPPQPQAKPVVASDSADRALDAMLKAPAEGPVSEEPLARMSRELAAAVPRPAAPAPESKARWPAPPEPRAPAAPPSGSKSERASLASTTEEESLPPFPPRTGEPVLRRQRRFSLDGLESVSGGGRKSGDRKAEPLRPTHGARRSDELRAREWDEEPIEGQVVTLGGKPGGPSWTGRAVRAAVAVVVLGGVGLGAYWLMFANPATRPFGRSRGGPGSAPTTTAAAARVPVDTARAEPPSQPVVPNPAPPTATPAAAAPAARRPARAAGADAGADAGSEVTGMLILTAVPTSAQILVDGVPSGAGGFLDSEVTAGRRRVQVSAPGFAALDTVIVVRDGGTVDLGQITLARAAASAPRTQPAPPQPAPAAPPTPAAAAPASSTGGAGTNGAPTGWIRVATYPATAAIYVDGRRVGTGVLVDLALPVGERRLRITNPGYLMFDTTITVDEFQTLRLGQVTLTKTGP